MTGAITAVFHFTQFKAPLEFDMLLIELVCLAAALSGVYMLLGQNWARWLALAWIAFHVVLSAFHSVSEVAVHAVLCAVLAYFLLRPNAKRYFKAVSAAP